MNYFEKHGWIREIISISAGASFGASSVMWKEDICCFWLPSIVGVIFFSIWLSMIIYAFKKGKKDENP